MSGFYIIIHQDPSHLKEDIVVGVFTNEQKAREKGKEYIYNIVIRNPPYSDDHKNVKISQIVKLDLPKNFNEQVKYCFFLIGYKNKVFMSFISFSTSYKELKEKTQLLADSGYVFFYDMVEFDDIRYENKMLPLL
jgi:hypothetical protein